jgi:hypothetical protein
MVYIYLFLFILWGAGYSTPIFIVPCDMVKTLLLPDFLQPVRAVRLLLTFQKYN